MSPVDRPGSPVSPVDRPGPPCRQLTAPAPCPRCRQAAGRVSEKLQSLSAGEHISLQQYTTALALHIMARCCFGHHMDDEQSMLSFAQEYEIVRPSSPSRLFPTSLWSRGSGNSRCHGHYIFLRLFAGMSNY